MFLYMKWPQKLVMVERLILQEEVAEQANGKFYSPL